MGRPRSAQPRSVTVGVRLSLDEVAALDARRGSLRRSVYLRRVFLQAVLPPSSLAVQGLSERAVPPADRTAPVDF